MSPHSLSPTVTTQSLVSTEGKIYFTSTSSRSITIRKASERGRQPPKSRSWLSSCICWEYFQYGHTMDWRFSIKNIIRSFLDWKMVSDSRTAPAKQNLEHWMNIIIQTHKHLKIIKRKLFLRWRLTGWVNPRALITVFTLFMLNCSLNIHSPTDWPDTKNSQTFERSVGSFKMHLKWPVESYIYEHSRWFPNFGRNSYVLTNIEWTALGYRNCILI